MEIRFSMTPRLIGLTFGASLVLLVLVFSLGFMVGQKLKTGTGGKPDSSAPAASTAPTGAVSTTLPTVSQTTVPQPNVPAPAAPSLAAPAAPAVPTPAVPAVGR